MNGSEAARIERAGSRYDFARKAIDLLERLDAPPTPTNYELWLLYAADPLSPLGVEIGKLMDDGAAITEQMSEELADRFLPRHKLSQEIQETGAELARQLAEVSRAVDAAQSGARSYGRTLAAGAQEFETAADVGQLRRLTGHLADATRRVERDNSTLAELLTRSTQDVRRLRDHMEQIRRESLTDPLTNLPNRKAFDLALEAACQGDRPVTLAFIDIDHFKAFNDTWGHQTGDQVIRYVASVLARAGQAPRLAARYGGEEFGMLFFSESQAQAAQVLEEVRREIASRALKRRSTNEELGAVTISIGLARREGPEEAESLLSRADAALYRSKRNGRDRLSHAEPLGAPLAA
ncbi:MAG: GGDEF domain-containing protein [Caulobacteraceae bacterium]|nr:GGDEF domain-containing protein [Caulobacter sp.]